MNSPRFIRFTPAHQPGDVFVRSDAVTSMAEIDYQNAFTGTPPASAPKVTAIGTTGGGTVIVKESPSQVIEALRAAENTHYVTVEYVMEDGDTSSLADDCDYALALKEAQDDAKIADERAEWYRKVAERAIADRDKALRDAAYYKQIADSRLDMLGHKQTELDRYAAEIGTEIAKSANLRDERDQLLAKLKDTTAALDKANAELNAARYDKFWHLRKGGLNDYIGNTTAPDPNQKAY